MSEPSYPRPELTPLTPPPSKGRTWLLALALALIGAGVVAWLLLGR